MDLNGDGHDDIISGSYWPGDMYIFYGKGDGTFEKGVILKDSEGKNLNAGGPWSSQDKPDMDSLASCPFAYDYDGDGVLDLIVGNIGGRVILIPNEGTRTKPSFNAKKRRALEADGQAIRVPGGDAGPIAVDWDQDGKVDLIVGSGDGSVWLYKNVSTSKEPKFAKGEALIPASKWEWGKPVPADRAPEGPGVRTKVCVTDWNGDGLPDLLVGDLWYEKPEPPRLSAEEQRRRDDLRKRQGEINTKWYELYTKLRKEKDLEDNAELKKVREERTAVYQELEKLDPQPQPRGSVWLYLRKGKPANGR